MDESSVRSRMQSVLDIIASDVRSIRTGRAAPSLVEEISISAYGGSQTLKVQELATISAPDSQTLIVSPWDKSIIGEIRQGILASNLGFTPAIDGDIIRMILPPLTTEDRQKYLKLLRAKTENGRIMIRQARGEVMHDLKKSFEAKEISEDEKFGQEKRLQEITDEFISKIEELAKKKEIELLRI